jgi:hypothetical protein
MRLQRRQCLWHKYRVLPIGSGRLQEPAHGRGALRRLRASLSDGFRLHQRRVRLQRGRRLQRREPRAMRSGPLQLRRADGRRSRRRPRNDVRGRRALPERFELRLTSGLLLETPSRSAA